MKQQQPSLLPLRATARRIGVKADSLRKAAEAGEIPAVRVGDDLLFDPKKVEQALTALADQQERQALHA